MNFVLIMHRFTGEVRRIEVDNLTKRLEQGDIVLLTSLGYSSSGEVFNVPSDSLAAECAARIGASKIIFLTEGQVLVDEMKRDDNGEIHVIQSLRLTQATALLDRFGLQVPAYNQVEEDNNNESASSSKLLSESILTGNGVTTSTITDSVVDTEVEMIIPMNDSNNIIAANASGSVDLKREGAFIRLIAR